jgi:hypothetical protein
VLVISKSVGDRFNYSVFQHQVRLAVGSVACLLAWALPVT